MDVDVGLGVLVDLDTASTGTPRAVAPSDHPGTASGPPASGAIIALRSRAPACDGSRWR